MGLSHPHPTPGCEGLPCQVLWCTHHLLALTAACPKPPGEKWLRKGHWVAWEGVRCLGQTEQPLCLHCSYLGPLLGCSDLCACCSLPSSSSLAMA